MTRAGLALLLAAWLIAPAAAQTQQEGEMRLYIQQLEERVRQLTGENERLGYELNQLRAQLGLPPLSSVPQQTGAVDPAAMPPAGAAGQPTGADPSLGAPPQELGALTAEPGTLPPAPQQPGDGAPVDLSALAGGEAGQILAPAPGATPIPAPDGAADPGAPVAPSATTALSGSPRDEYDLAYGYVLTGDYGLAEESFKTWLAAFPNDPQAADAEFWLGESHLQQGEYRDAANAFLAVYKASPDSQKGPDALLKLGISLAALGEQAAACATLAELGRRYPQASESIMSRVRDEEERAGC